MSISQPGNAVAGGCCGVRLRAVRALLLQFMACIALVAPAAGWASVITASGVAADPLGLEPDVRQAFASFYVLDYDQAIARFRAIENANPNNPLAVDFVLETVVFRELNRLDLLDTTFYAHDGFLTGKHLVSVDPAVTGQVNLLAQKAIGLANADLQAHPGDADALFARGWARSLSSVYAGLVQRSFITALRQALDARRDDERVLQEMPNYADAKLVVGIHEYVVGSLPFVFKMIAGVSGMPGSKSKGLAALRDDAAKGVITSVEASTALALFLRREAKYSDAVAVAQRLKSEYPRNFLFWLEVANLIKDSGEGPRAIVEYRAVLSRARSPGYFHSAHLELAWFGLGDTLQGQGDYAEAASAFVTAAGQPGASQEVKARSDLDAGKVYDLLHQRDKAIVEYQAAIRQAGGSGPGDAARKYLKTPYSVR
jgi:tetratricopeptide (TPR) repeat protein